MPRRATSSRAAISTGSRPASRRTPPPAPGSFSSTTARSSSASSRSGPLRLHQRHRALRPRRRLPHGTEGGAEHLPVPRRGPPDRGRLPRPVELHGECRGGPERHRRAGRARPDRHDELRRRLLQRLDAYRLFAPGPARRRAPCRPPASRPSAHRRAPLIVWGQGGYAGGAGPPAVSPPATITTARAARSASKRHPPRACASASPSTTPTRTRPCGAAPARSTSTATASPPTARSPAPTCSPTRSWPMAATIIP